MHELEKQHLLKPEVLDQVHYVQSLLQEAHRLGLLSDMELERIQLQALQLLAKQTARFTGGMSSSVREETAQSIFQSMLYTIGIYLKSLSDVDASLTALKETPLSALLKLGKQMIKEQFSAAKRIWEDVRCERIVTDNIAYNDTVESGLPEFFTAYDADFAAHETPASIDYPLSNDKMNLVGIEYIQGYLQKLALENQFCNLFSAHDIGCLLRGYDAHCEDLLINIFELILTNSLAAVLANSDPGRLRITRLDMPHLQHRLRGLNHVTLCSLMHDTALQLMDELCINDSLLQRHIMATTEVISVRVESALTHHRLESVFIIVKEDDPTPALHFLDGEKLEDELFRQIADEIRDCRYASDKVAIIKREIHSIEDLVDVLEGYCIFNDEFASVFTALDDTELALLLKRLPTHVVDPNHHFTENEKEWHQQLRNHMQGIEVDKATRIRAMAEKLVVD